MIEETVRQALRRLTAMSFLQNVLPFLAQKKPPPPPPLGSLRIASPGDILRLGVVATAGFFYSEQFMFERPFHKNFPQDTIIFFRHEVENFVKSSEHIVLVCTDKYAPDESSKTEAIIPLDNGWEPPRAGEEVIVGLGVWKLNPGSKRVGDFQNDTAPYPDLPRYEGSDLDEERAKRIEVVAGAADHKYFDGLSTMERIVVHPAYWKRSHGSTIARWGVALASIDGIDQGVLATTMGASLFTHVGYQHISETQVEGDERSPEGFSLAILRYRVA